MRAVIEPDAQTHVRVTKDAERQGAHVRQRRIAEQQTEEAVADRERDGVDRRIATAAGSVVAPVSRRPACVDERKLELPRAIEVHRRTADRDAALIIHKLRHLRVQLGSEEERDEGKSAEERFHGGGGAVRSRNRNEGDEFHKDRFRVVRREAVELKGALTRYCL